MKRRIYKKWLKNPMNKRLMWKFCKPFTTIPPVVHSKPYEPGDLCRGIDRIERMMYEETAIPRELFLYGIQGSTTSGNVSGRMEKRIRKCEKNMNTNY